MKALFIGLGGIGQRHLRNLRTIAAERGETLEILAYRVRRYARVLTDQLGVEDGKDLESLHSLKVFDHLENALYEDPEVAFICNPTSLHIFVALQAAKAGCHLFLEKPVSHNLDGVDELLEVTRQRRLVTLVGYQLRFHPLLRRIKQLLDQEAIGRILAVRIEVGEDIRKWHPYEDYRQTYASRRDLGGGVILSQIHEMDYAHWFFGMPRRVFALGGHLSNLEVDVEDVASILMEFTRDGRTLPVHFHEDYVQFPPSRGCQIIGDAGKIILDLRGLSLSVYDAAGKIGESRTLEGFERNKLFLDEMSHFLACVRGEEQPIVPLEDGVRSLRMALAARQSLAEGNVVTL